MLITFIGPAPAGCEGCHKDGIRNHNILTNLKWGTKKDNGQDKVLHGNSLWGSRNLNSKLNNSQVRFIRQMALNGHPQREIAKAFGVGKSTVGHIISNRTWNHLI